MFAPKPNGRIMEGYMNLKSLISLIITIIFSLAFGYVVVIFADKEIAKNIVSAFLTVATSVIGFFIGYQNGKKEDKKEI